MPGKYIIPSSSSKFTGGTVTGLTDFVGGFQISGITFDLSNPVSGETLFYDGSKIVLRSGNTDASQVSYINGSYTTVQQALDALLYVTPVINTFTNNIGTIELGNIINSVDLTWTINKNVTSQSLNQGIGSISSSLRSYSQTGLTMTSTTTYTLTVGDGTNNVSKSTTVSFQEKRYWGVSPNTTLNNAQILALSSEFATSRVMTKTLDATGGNYLYFASPVSFGVGTFTVGGLVTTFQQSTISFTNASGYIDNYYLYRSTNLQNGSSITVQIT